MRPSADERWIDIAEEVGVSWRLPPPAAATEPLTEALTGTCTQMAKHSNQAVRVREV
jgi:hypothetical protein